MLKIAALAWDGKWWCMVMSYDAIMLPLAHDMIPRHTAGGKPAGSHLSPVVSPRCSVCSLFSHPPCSWTCSWAAGNQCHDLVARGLKKAHTVDVTKIMHMTQVTDFTPNSNQTSVQAASVEGTPSLWVHRTGPGSLLTTLGWWIWSQQFEKVDHR